MTLAIRDEIVGRLEAELSRLCPGVPIRFANLPFDNVNPPDRFLEVDYELSGGDSVFLGYSSPTRVYGYIYVRVHTVGGGGTRWGAGVCESVFNYLKSEVFDNFRTRPPEYSRPGVEMRHYVQAVKCSLWADIPHPT